MTDDELFTSYGLLRETASLLGQLAEPLEGISRAWWSTPRQAAELKMHAAAVARLRRQSQTTITSESVQRLGEFFDRVLEWPESEQANFIINELASKCTRMFTDFALDARDGDWGRTCNWGFEFDRIAQHLGHIIPSCEKHEVISARLVDSVEVDWEAIAAACEDAIEQPEERPATTSMIVAGPEKPTVQLPIVGKLVGWVEITNEAPAASASETASDPQPLKSRFDPGQCPKCQSRMRVKTTQGATRFCECSKCGHKDKRVGPKR